MLSCKETIKILSSEDVSFRQWVELKMHLVMCEHCSVYNKHLKVLRLGFKKLFNKITKSNPEDVERMERNAIEKLEKMGSNK